MWYEIIVPIVVAVLSFAGTLAGAYFANKKSTALFDYRLEQLENEVRKHNNVIARTYNLEKDTAIIHEDIKMINDELKKLGGSKK